MEGKVGGRRGGGIGKGVRMVGVMVRGWLIEGKDECWKRS